MTDTNRPPTQLALADVARYPRPGTTAPRRVAFTPDGKAVTYLFSGAGTLEQQLWRFDLASGERRALTGEDTAAPDTSEFSIEEQLRRERSRTRERGVTDYQFVQADENGPLVLLVPRGGALYTREEAGSLTKVSGSEGALDATLSPDGRRVAFVRDDELWVAALGDDPPPRKLTHGAGNGITNGVAEYIAQEEMGRGKGFWWSPDSRQIAYVRADSSHIPPYPIVHQGAATPVIEEHRYPFAGQPNARVRLGVLPIDGATETRWLDLGTDDDIYLARVNWRPDSTLTAQIESRDQRTLRLVAFDERGDATTLIEEHGDPWINLADDLHFLPSGEFLW
ncbi:MAG TPA: DPP IV N-terminal domain-containing protein, partial [Thermomicrobiales bacterium]